MSGYAGYQDPKDTGSDHSAYSFLINSIVNRLATTALVRVVAVTNTGGVAPVGTVDVIPMVHQVDGDGNPTPHGTIHALPYIRLQGGTDAVILDPKVGDIGLALFCSRDISSVKRIKAPTTPGSNRKFDWADGIYLGGVLNGTPVQYVQFSAAGINVTSPTKVTITAPNVEIDATTLTVNAAIQATGLLTSNGHDISSTHRHTASGGTGIGGVPL